MVLSACIISLKNPFNEQIANALCQSGRVEIHGVSDDRLQLVAIFEAQDSKDIERLHEEISKQEGVLDVAHHAFHFEDDVEALCSANQQAI